MSNIKYEFLKDKPVARFYYQGNHSHPVRRTVLIVQQNDKVITGYEVREGSKTRSLAKAPVKSYLKSNIAKVCQIDRKCSLRKKAENKNSTTYVRENLRDFVKTGP
jgi:hypothetical protein